MTKDYSEKIAYYTYKVNKAIEQLSTKDLAFYANKLSYFMDRQSQVNREKLIFGQFPA